MREITNLEQTKVYTLPCWITIVTFSIYTMSMMTDECLAISSWTFKHIETKQVVYWPAFGRLYTVIQVRR